MLIFHIATLADWEHARRTGRYTTSTLGRSLEQEGLIHAARREQVRGVFTRYYADAGQRLVLLMIDTAKLDSRWSEDAVGEETYPHIHGPLNTSAVKDVIPLDAAGNTPSWRSMFFRDMATRIGLAVMAMTLSVVGSLVGNVLDADSGAAIGALVGLGVGVLLVWAFYAFRKP